jgi:hypothetical protein
MVREVYAGLSPRFTTGVSEVATICSAGANAGAVGKTYRPAANAARIIRKESRKFFT